jgi:hypothetical protein
LDRDVVEMSSFVEEGSGELQEGEGGRAESGEGRAVGMGEDLEEELGREARGAELVWS